DAAGQLNRRPMPLDERLRHPLTDALCDRLRGHRVRAGEYDDEFLAAIAADDVRLAQLRLDRRNDRREAGVAGRVPEGIVDGFEEVEIQKQHRDGQAVRARSTARGFELLQQ